MQLITFLIIIPIIGSLFLLFLKDKGRDVVVLAITALIALASILLAFHFFINIDSLSIYTYNFESHLVDLLYFCIGIVISIVIFSMAIYYKKICPIILSSISAILEIKTEFFIDKSNILPAFAFNIDILTVIMVLIVGIIGSAICVFAIGYMKDFQNHLDKDACDRRGFFFSICILFLSAMFLIIFSNKMSAMLIGWEITTLCSFLLIGYTKTEEAIKNSFLQITFNSIGGICFAIGIIICMTSLNVSDFFNFINIGISNPSKVALPLTFFTIAILTKAAQLPFHTWLLGAMVAPTPTSALLHSSTMVKAGVFLAIKLIPLYEVCTIQGHFLALFGGITFIYASILAIAMQNGKRVLAYSTIANLGLIVMCCGIATELSTWAAALLLIFHALAKSILFLCMGVAEHRLGSRDIENLDYLFEKLPQISRFMMFSMFVMFIAPFGMLIAKWGTIVSLADTKNIILILFICFGSAATFAYWAKWLGKLSAITGNTKPIKPEAKTSEIVILYFLTTILVIINILIPLISNIIGNNLILLLFNNINDFNNAMSNNDLVLLSILSILIFVMLFLLIGRKTNNKTRQLLPFMSGYSICSQNRTFKGSIKDEVTATTKNMYLNKYISEKYVLYFQLFATLLILIELILSCINVI